MAKSRSKNRRKKKSGMFGIVISGSVIIGIVIAIIFYYLYGGMMLLRYILGALMFATVTVTLVSIIRKFGPKLSVRL